MKKAVFSGSFDPITKGHLDVITRAAKIFDELYVAVCYNTQKGGGMFTPEERLTLINAALGELEFEGTVKAEICEGLLAEYAAARGIDTIVRGVRSASEYEWETAMAEMNRDLGSLETVVFPTRPELAHHSSTYCRDMIIYGREDMVLPSAVAEALKTLKK